ncbi:MAG: ComEC/Rec2 family competence protein [Cryobacterium sp.]|nr:ComEC/Rec2 family competence protein [Cryobacterium sp.]
MPRVSSRGPTLAADRLSPWPPIDARLAVPVAVAWAVLAVCVAIPGALTFVAVAAWVTAGTSATVALALARWRRVLVAASLILGITALLVTAAAAQAPKRSPAMLEEAAKAGRFVRVELVLDQTVSGASDRVRATIVAATMGDARLESIAAPAVVFGWNAADGCCGLGATIHLAGTLRTTEPGDGAAFLIFARGRAEVTDAPPWYLDWANDVRASFREASDALPGDGGDLLGGLAIGDTSAVSPSLNRAMIDTALSHLTAVSGANCAVVVGIVMALGAAAGLSRRARIGIALVTLLAFVVLVTPEASVVRAATMATVVLLSLGSGRPVRGIPVLALAVAVLLVIDPWWCRSFGFVLSVLATAGLLILAPVLAQVLGRWMPTPLALVLAIPLSAQLACQPVLILLTPAIPVYGVLANVLAAPAAPLATVVGLLACVGLSVLEPLGAMLTGVAWVPSAWIAAVARFCASLPAAQAPWVEGVVGVLLAIGLVALIVRAATRDRRATAVLGAALVLYLAIVAGLDWGRRSGLPGDWQLAACPIGQGDAMLVRSAGRVALIDTGPDPELLADCLDRLGIAHIDLLVLSHYDLDHVGGTSAVHGRVTQAVVGNPGTDAGAQQVLRDLAGTGARVDTVERGATGHLGELRWRVLWPAASLRVEPGNDASVVVAFEGVGECADGCLSSIFLGDLGERAQARLLAIAHPQPVAVVKVSHHGSRDQSERLYERLAAQVGLIGVGENRYGHPTQSILEVLGRTGTTVARTDTQGLLLVSPRPDGLIALWTERNPLVDRTPDGVKSAGRVADVVGVSRHHLSATAVPVRLIPHSQ